MSVIRVPRWIIAKAFDKEGVRMPKKVLLRDQKEEKPNNVIGFSPNGFHGLNKSLDKALKHFTNDHTIVLADKKLEFENWEYRFWAVEILNREPGCAECRCCGRVFGVKKPRRTHASDNECFRKLCDAYDLLKKDQRCVICDAKTAHSEWGVPMCNRVQCIDKWMHDEAQPQPLTMALALNGSLSSDDAPPFTGALL